MHRPIEGHRNGQVLKNLYEAIQTRSGENKLLPRCDTHMWCRRHQKAHNKWPLKRPVIPTIAITESSSVEPATKKKIRSYIVFTTFVILRPKETQLS